MFCPNCGTQTENTASFCPNCGTKIQQGAETPLSPAPAAYDGATPAEKSTKKFTPAIMAVAGIVAVVLVITLLFSGGGYKKTVKNYFKALENNDPDLMYEEVVAQYWIDYIEKGSGDPYAMEMIEDSINSRRHDWNCGEDLSVSYEIVDEKRATDEELEELEEDIYDRFAYFICEERDDFSISDAYVLSINFTVKGEDDTKTFHFNDGLLVMKEDGDWRVPRGIINCSFYSND